MLPALGKGGPLPRPSCLRGACSSRRAGRPGQESGCGGRKRGMGGRESSAPGAGASANVHRRRSAWPPGAPPPGRRTSATRLLAPTSSYCGCLVARLPGTKARGCSATRRSGPILLKSRLPRRAGGGAGSREALLPLRRGRPAVPLAAAGRARPRVQPPRSLLSGRTRAEERRRARQQAPAADPSPSTHPPARPGPGRRRRGAPRGWRRSRWLQGARAAPRPGSHPFPR